MNSGYYLSIKILVKIDMIYFLMVVGNEYELTANPS